MDDDLARMAGEFPRWEFGYTINNRPRGRRLRTSPPVWMWADSWTELRDEIVAWEAGRQR